MKNQKTPKTDVELLRKLGIKVCVHHDMNPVIVELPSGQVKCGIGQTFVSLITKDGKEYLGASLCVDKCYDKKKGVSHALQLAYESVQLGKQILPNWRELPIYWDEEDCGCFDCCR